jgi:hypothetical protein
MKKIVSYLTLVSSNAAEAAAEVPSEAYPSDYFFSPFAINNLFWQVMDAVCRPQFAAMDALLAAGSALALPYTLMTAPATPDPAATIRPAAKRPVLTVVRNDGSTSPVAK